MLRDHRTSSLFDSGVELDLAQRCVSYLTERGWRVENRKPHFCRDRKGNLRIIGDKDSLWWSATFAIVPGVQFAFHFHAQVRPMESDVKRKRWMTERNAAGELCCWFSSESEFINWYLDYWQDVVKTEALFGLRRTFREFQFEPKAMVMT